MTTLDLSALDSIAANAQELLGQRTYAAISEFIEDPNNPRTDFDPIALQTLADDIKLHGIIQPVNVVRLSVEQGGKLQIKSGARRLRAAKLAGMERLPYVLADEVHTTGFAQVAENEQRANLSSLDLATFAHAQIASGLARSEVMAKLHIKEPSELTRLLAFLDPPQWMREAFVEGRITDRQAFADLRRYYEGLTEEAQRSDLINMCAHPKQLTREFVLTVRAQPDALDALDSPPSALTGTATAALKTETFGEHKKVDEKQKPKAKGDGPKAEKKPKLYSVSLAGTIYTFTVVGATATVKRTNPVKSWALDPKKTTFLG